MKNTQGDIAAEFMGSNIPNHRENLYKLRNLAQKQLDHLLVESPQAQEEIKSAIAELIQQEKLITALESTDHKIALEQKIKALEKELDTDTVTGGKNRRSFETEMHKAIDEIRENPEQEHVLVFIDLDGFKTVNDQCGHEEGDYALIDAQNALDAMINPEIDTAARLGGDEMVLLLKAEEGRDLSVETIRHVVRKNFQGMARWDGDIPHPIGASIGLCTLNAKDLKKMNTESYAAMALKQADEAMYADKEDNKKDRLQDEYNNILQALEAETRELDGSAPNLNH